MTASDIFLGPRTEPRVPAAVSPPFRATRVLAHLLRFVVSGPYRVLYLLGFLVCTPRRVVRLFLCVAFWSPAPCSRMSFHLLISRLVFLFPVVRRVSSLHLLRFSFDLYASMSRSVRTIALSYDILGLPYVEY